MEKIFHLKKSLIIRVKLKLGIQLEKILSIKFFKKHCYLKSNPIAWICNPCPQSKSTTQLKRLIKIKTSSLAPMGAVSFFFRP